MRCTYCCCCSEVTKMKLVIREVRDECGPLKLNQATLRCKNLYFSKPHRVAFVVQKKLNMGYVIFQRFLFSLNIAAMP